MAFAGSVAPTSPKRVRSKRWLEISVVGVLVAVVWFVTSDKTLKYREEVQLTNGNVIEIERVIKGEPMGEIGGPGGWTAKYSSLSVLKGSQEGPPRWESESGLMPLLLEPGPVPGEWRIVATFYTCDAWHALGKPQLPYAEFRSTPHGWERQPLSAELIGREANVLTRIDFRGERSPVTLDVKRARNSDPRTAPEFLRIVPRWNGC